MKVVVARVVGNELPPRDLPGSKLRSLTAVLEHDARLGLSTFWVLNHIIDPRYRLQVRNLLVNARVAHSELLFDPNEFKKQLSDDDRIRYGININAARNFAITCARQSGDFVVSLDQDCFFETEQWSKACDVITEDQRLFPGRRYYSLLMRRLIDQNVRTLESYPVQEPHIVFRKDARKMFDASIPFGQNDKMALLHKLGYSDAPEYLLSGDKCKCAGNVFHLSYSDPRIETDQAFRVQMRRKSLLEFLCKLESM